MLLEESHSTVRILYEYVRTRTESHIEHRSAQKILFVNFTATRSLSFIADSTSTAVSMMMY